MSNINRYLQSLRELFNKKRMSNALMQYRYDLLMNKQQLANELEAHNVAEPKPNKSATKQQAVSKQEGKSAAESTATKRNKTAKKALSVNKYSMPSWADVMKNSGVDVNEFGNLATERFKENFIPDTSDVKYPERIPETRWQQKMAAQREVDINTKDINEQIEATKERIVEDEVSRRIAQQQMETGLPVSDADKDTIRMQAERTAEDSAEVQQLKQQRDAIERSIRNEIDPDYVASDIFEMFGTPKLAEINSTLKDYIDLFRVVDANFKNGTATNEERLSAAELVYNTRNELDKLNQKYQALNSYIKHVGLPNSFDKLPNHLKPILLDLVPGVDQNPEFFKEFKDYIKEYSKDKRKERALQAGEKTKESDQASGEVLFNPDLLQKMLEDISTMMKIDDILSSAEEFKNTTNNAFTLASGAGLYLQKNATDMSKAYDPQYKNYQEAQRILNKAQRYQELAQKVKATNKFWSTGNLYNAGQALKEFTIEQLADPIGLVELFSTDNQLDLMKKLNSDEKLTSSEQALMDALALNQVIHDKYQDLEDVNSYKWTNIAANSVKFMAEFMIGNSALNAISKAGTKAVGKQVTKNTAAKVADFISGELGKSMRAKVAYQGMESLGREGIKSAILQYAHKTPGFLMQAAGDAVNALLLEGTVLLPRTMSDVNQLRLGRVSYDKDEQGNVSGTGYEGGLSLGKALYTGITRDWIENFSEQMGEWGIGHLLGRPFAWVGKKAGKVIPSNVAISLTKSAEKLADSKIAKNVKLVFSYTKGFRDILAAGEFHGIVGETAEEYYGMALQHLMGVSDSGKNFWDDITSKDNFMDIFGGIALSTAFLGTFGIGTHLHAKHKYDSAKSDAKEHFGDKWDSIEQAIVMSDQKNLPSVMTSLTKVYNSEDDVDQLLRYYDALESYRGSSYAAQSMYDESMKSVHEQTLEESRRTGYAASSIQFRKDIDRAIKIAEAELQRQYDIDDLSELQQFILNQGGVESFIRNYNVDADQQNALYVYENLLEMQEGADEKLQFDFQDAQQKIDRGIRKITFRSNTPNTSDKIINVRIKDENDNESDAYVISGDFQYSEVAENKNTEDDNAAPTYTYQALGQIKVRDKDGFVKNIDASDIVGVNTVADARIISTIHQMQYAQAQKNINDNVAQQRGIEYGDKYELKDGKVMSIISSTNDGGILYTITDKETGEEHLYSADSQQTMNQIIEDAQTDRANMVYDKVWDMIKQRNQQSQVQLTPNPEVSANTDLQINEALAARAEEAAKPVTSFIETKTQGKQTKRKALKTWSNVKKAIKSLKQAKSFEEFKQILKDNKIEVDDKYDGRLNALYKALREGNITNAQFAAVFIPDQFKPVVLSEAQLLQFNNLEIDADGIATTQRKPKVQDTRPAVDISISPEYLIEDEEEEETKPSVDISSQPEYLFTDEDLPPVDASPAPEATNAGAVEANNPHPLQLQALDNLMTKIAQDAKVVHREWTSAFHYFIEEDGRIELHRRVHTVLDDQYEPKVDEQEKVNKLTQELVSLYNTDKEAFKKRVNELAADKNVEGYFKYLEQDNADVTEAIQGLATTLLRFEPHVSVKYGNLLDEICRKIFGNIMLTYEDYKDVMTKDVFDDIVRQIIAIQTSLRKKGYRIITTPVVFYSQLYDKSTQLTIRVAGETDMIAIDENGNYYILDFKTSYKNFTPETFDIVPTRKIDGYRSAKRSTRDQYSMLLTMYQLMLQDNLKGFVNGIFIVPWTLKYYYNGPFRLDGAKNEIDSKPYLIPLFSSTAILDRFEKVDDSIIYELLEAVYKQSSFIEDQLDVLYKSLDECSELVNDEINTLLLQLGSLMDDYDSMQSENVEVDTLRATYNKGEVLLSTISDIMSTLSRISQERADNLPKNPPTTPPVTPPAPPITPPSSQTVPPSSSDDWKQKTTTHKSSSNGFIGIEDAVALDDLNLKLRSVTGNPDFIRNGKFKFIMLNGRVHVLVTYGGHTYQPVSVHTGDNNLGRIFYRTVKSLFSKLIPGKAIVLTIKPSRTNGIIIQGLRASLIDKGLISTKRGEPGIYLYDALLSSSDITFGVTVNEGGQTVVSIPGQTKLSRDIVYRYDETSSQPVGTVVMMVKRPYEELPTDKQPLVPTTVYTTKMTEGDVDLIIGILSGDYCRDKNVSRAGILSLMFYENGVNKGLTNEQVLNMLIAYGSYNRKDRPHVHIELDQHNGNIIRVVGNVVGDPKDDVAVRSFDFSTVQGKELFKEFLLHNVDRNLDFSLMTQRLGKITDKSSLLYGLKTFFNSKIGQSLVSEHGALKFGNSSIVFDAKDFKDESNPADDKGLSGLGWYIRHGFVESAFDGFENTLLEFDHNAPLLIVDEQEVELNIPLEKQIEKEIENASEEGVESLNFLDDLTPDNTLDFGLELKTIDKDDSKDKIDVDAAKKELRRMLGDEFDIKIFDGLIKRFENGLAAVGACWKDAIWLSKQAISGTEYHEAFHRVTDVVFSQKERERAYRMWRNAKKRKDLSDSQVSEGMADDFMYFVQNRPTFKASWRIFKSIYDYIKGIEKVGGFRLFWLYRNVYKGKYAKRKASSEAALKNYNDARWKLTKRGATFDEIVTQHQYSVLINSLTGILLNPATQVIKWDGSNISDLKVDRETLIKSSAFKALYSNAPEETKNAIKELLKHWDSVEPDIATYLSTFATDFNVRYEDQNDASREGSSNEVPVVDNTGDVDENDDFDQEIASASNEEHMKASYEFSLFSRTSAKVKFFFSGILKQAYVKDLAGNVKKIPVLNEFGLPEMLDSKYVFSEVLSEFHDCTSVSDFYKRLCKMGTENPIYETISKRFEELYDQAYPKDGPVDYDAEQVIVLIFSTIRAQKNNFEIVKSEKNNLGGYTLRVFSSDAGHSAKHYKEDWSTQFAAGASAYIKQDDNGNFVMKGNRSPEIFSVIYDRFYGKNGMSVAYSTEGRLNQDDPKYPKYTIEKVTIDVSNPTHVELTKRSVCRFLRTMGIIFEKDVFDYMLMHMYGNTGVDAMTKFIQDRSKTSFFSFCNFVKGFQIDGKLNLTNKDGANLINGQAVEKIFNSSGFVKELANWKYAYRTAHDQLSVLATNNNKYYVISQNNIMSDRLSELENGGNERSQLFDTPYVLVELDDGTKVGSLLAKHVLEEGHTPLKMATLAGFRTDAKDDLGIDYATINRREDYIAKMTILQHRVTDPVNGQVSSPILFPTLSDKKTWCYIYGVHLPGINFANVVADTKKDGKANPFIDSVVDQFLEYAITEDRSIRQVLDTIDSLPPEERVKNFHDGSKIKDKLGATYVTIQGGRYSSLLGVYDAQGNYIEFNRVLDDNGVYLSEEANYKLAHKYFFDPQEINENGTIRMETPEETLERLRSQIRTLLSKQMELELAYAEELGLIEKVGNYPNPMYNYRNVGLDSQLIYSIEQQFKDGKEHGIEVNKIIHSYAVYLLIADTMTRHMMSIQEVERIFAGNPSAFKFKYDSNGHLIDRTTDQLKRLGGLVSTGQNNVEIPGIPEEYTVAEVDNEMIQAPDFEHIAKLIYEGELRAAYIRQYLDRKFKTFDNLSEEDKDLIKIIELMEIVEIEKSMNPTTLDIVEQISKAKSDAFRKSKEEKLDGIDVADGGSYISDKMCENLLRMAGSFDNEVARAFKVLRGEEVDGKVYTVADTREIAKAFHLIMTTVIGTLKYTAYGFRYVNGCAIPYYNKTALFPMFKNICTGKMAKIYKKMQDDGLDMLMVNSSVKVGSQGSKSDEWNNPNVDFNDPNGFHYNMYKQKYAYLRKQFNTDPKEKEIMSMGTQMTKIALSTLIPGRTYNVDGKEYNVDEKEYNVDGKEMDATLLRDHIMDCLNKLSDEGVKEIQKMFFDEDGIFDIDKFSATLTKELQGRGASAEMLDAVSVVERNGHKELKIPLVALSGMNWILSIIKSMIDKRVVDTNTPGKAFYQRSVWLMEGPTTVLNDTDLPPSLNGGRRLLMLNEEGSMDCVLSIDYFEDILKQATVKTGRKVKKTVKKKRLEYPKVTKYGSTTEDILHTIEVEYEEEIEVDERISVSQLSFEEQKQWLIDHKIIGGPLFDDEGNAIPGTGAKANIIGYRIPTQAISSIHALRCVDVLPTVRDTVILPAEFTKITGSDFDIDKVFLSTLYRDKDGNIEFKDDVQKQTANDLLQAYLAILKDTYRSFAELNGSIDNDTELIKEVVRDIFGSLSQVVAPYAAYTMRSQFSSKDEFINGKQGIGPFALNNNNHILTMLYGVSFKHGDHSIIDRLQLNSLHDSTDRYGKSIMSWLSGFINAHVDVAKDPYISKLNVNSYTYNLVSMLIRTGYGEDTLYFTSQPIMRQLAEAYANATGKYMIDNFKNQFEAVEEAENNVLLNLINSYMGTLYMDVNEAVKMWLDNKFNGYNNPLDLIEPLLKDNTHILRFIAKNNINDIANSPLDYTMSVGGKEIVLTVADVQILVALANKEFKPYASALSELVKYSKIDTKKEGKSVIEQSKYLEGYEGIFDPEKASSVRFLFDTESLDRMSLNSYIGPKTRNATRTFLSILGQQMIEATSLFEMQMLIFMRMCPSLKEYTTKDLKSLNNQLLAKIKSGFFFGTNGYAKKIGVDVKGLVTGNNTIYDRLLRIKADLANDPKYADMVDPDGNPLNYLLRNIVSGSRHEFRMPTTPAKGTVEDTYANAKFIKPLSFMNDETVNADELSQAWDDLLRDTAHPELQKFAQDLIVYAFITSGDNGGRVDIFKYVPNSWKLGIEELGESYQGSYTEYMNNVLSDYKAGRNSMVTADYEDIILNNWHDNRYVPIVKDQNSEGEQQFEHWMSDPVSGFPIMLGGITRSGKVFDSEAKFIKMKRQHVVGEVNGQREYTIYKRIGYGTRQFVSVKDGKKQTFSKIYPVYIMVDPSGVKFSNTEQVLGYGQSPVQEAKQVVLALLNNLIDTLNAANANITTGSTEEIIQQIINFADSKHNAKIIDTLVKFGLPSNLATILKDMISINPVSEQIDRSSVTYYTGNIVPESNTIFVFGSNIEGRHGKGAAKVAMDMFGALYGVSEGITGQAYALPTKDLAKGERSLTKELIVENIRHMYEAAKANPTLNFKVAYRNMPDEKSLNGYTGREMIEMFLEAGPIPSNVWFSQEWVNTGLFNVEYAEKGLPTATEGTYAVPNTSQPQQLYAYGRYSEGRPNYEVSSKGDSRFSAMNARFSQGTILFGHDVGGRTIESVYQHGVKQGDWVTDNNNKTGAPKDKTIITGNTENDSYIQGYLPLWQEWARQNPQLIEELASKASGKVLTDQFASTQVSQARALSDILNSRSTTLNTTNNPSEFVMLSGGAPGADSVWGDIASEFGVTKQNHWHHGPTSESNAPRGNIEISEADYNEGRTKVAQAAKMNWGYQYGTMKDDRLVRNWAQVKYADAIFAIGHIVGKGEKVFPNQKDDTRVAATTVVQGGTGYAVGMAILEGKPVYVFDQERGKWAANINGQWQWLDEAPTLTKNFAGIGTRNINEAGKQAIRDVFEKTFDNKSVVAAEFDQFVRDNSSWNDSDEYPTDEMEHCKH